MGVFRLRVRPSTRSAVPLARLIDGGPVLNLAGVLLVYERSLAALDAIHQSGRVHGAVTAEVIGIGANGAVTLDEPTPVSRAEDQPLVFELQGPRAAGAAACRDLRALTLVLVDTLTSGSDQGAIPVAARELVRRGLGDQGALPAAARDLLADTDEVGRAFFGDCWRDAGAAALMTAVSQLAAGAPRGAVRRRGRRRLAGAAIGATILLAAPLLVGRALALDPSTTGQTGRAGVSSAIVAVPGDALVSPLTAGPGSGVRVTLGPIPTRSPGSPSNRRRPTPAPTVAAALRRGATSELTPPVASSTAAATPSPTASASASPTPSPSPSPSPTPTTAPTPTPKATSSPTPKPTTKPSPTATPTPKPSPTATPKPTAKPTP
ncbi:MAG: hypothetical protein M3Z57_08950 [Candidatus Dormibacteraeota bacterium]|nr:hypothetical protein [Candidatus Dormibacteraeota bacterium]